VPDFYQIKGIGDLSGVLGLGISIVGFLVTAIAAIKAKNAAQAARRAAAEMKSELNKFDIVKNLSETMMSLEEVKTLQRNGVWELLPAKYAEIRKGLLTAKLLAPGLTPAHRKAIQSAIQTCASVENEIETALAADDVPSDVPGFNQALNGHIIELQVVLIHVRNQIGQ
jgi:hypothetical protein